MSCTFVAEQTNSCKLRICIVKKGTLLHKRSFLPTPSLNRSGPVWFSREAGYGSSESYGAYLHKYELLRDLKLVDVAKTATRQCAYNSAVQHNIVVPCGDDNDPFNSAWGEGCNEQAAVTLCNLAQLVEADGWIAEDWDDDTLEGPFEVMLCCPDLCASLLQMR
jgi:hypothetical protein